MIGWRSMGEWFASQSYRCCSLPMMTWGIRSHLAAAILLGTAVTEERAVFGIGDLMVFVTDLGAHCAHTYPIHHLTGVTVVPVEWEDQGETELVDQLLAVTDKPVTHHLHHSKHSLETSTITGNVWRFLMPAVKSNKSHFHVSFSADDRGGKI